MELLEHDKKNIEELLYVIIDISNYYNQNPLNNNDKFYQQPIMFNKPKNIIQWKNVLQTNNKFIILDPISLERDRGLYDTDSIFYSKYILLYNHPLIFHDLLDWQLIIVFGESVCENKIYTNINKDSELYGFYVYTPGGDDKILFKYYIIASNDTQFKIFWENLIKLVSENVSESENRNENKSKRESESENEYENVDNNSKLRKYEINELFLPIKVINIMVSQNTCLLDNYNYSEDKKKKVINYINETYNLKLTKLNLTLINCGTCYWVKIESEETLIAGDLFYDRLQDKFITKGKRNNFLKWEDSFHKITKALNF